MCIKILCHSNEIYLRYKVRREKTGQNIDVSSTSRIGPIPTKQELLFYVTDNDIEG